MTTLPAITVSIAFTTAPDDPDPQWEDVTQYVRAQQGISITRGRQDEFGEVQPSRLGLTLDNRDGRFTPERTGSPYYPNVKKSKRIRVSARWPLASVQTGNYVTNSTFETDVAGWQAFGFGYGGGSVARSTVRASASVASALITWPTFATGSLIGTPVTGLVIGKTYTASAFVYVPTGSPNVRVTRGFTDSGSFTSVKDAFVRISHTFAATSSTHSIGIEAVNTTAGQQCWVDSVQVDEGSTVVAFTSNPPPITHRFTGYVDEWPVAWADASATVADVAITATSRLARLAKGRELRSIIECEYLQDNPVAYYPFGDPEGTIRAGNVSTRVQVPLTAAGVAPSGGAGIFFGQATGPGTDDLTAATFSPASASSGYYMRGLFDQPLITVPTDMQAIECFFSTTVAGGGLVSIEPSSLTGYLGLSISATGRLQGVNRPPGGVSRYTLTSAATVTDGATHHAVLREYLVSPGVVDSALFLDGVAVASTTLPLPPLDDYFFQLDRMSAGATAGSSVTAPSTLFNGVLAHIAVYAAFVADTRWAAHAAAGLTGFNGERSDQRIARLARYAGVPTSEVSTETGQSLSIVNQMTTGQQPIALMQDVAKTEAGILFDAGDGTLTSHARSHRYNSASVLTLSGGGAELDGDLQPKLDDQGLANDITATRQAGVAMRAVDTASVTDHGIYRDDLQLLTTDDNEVFDAAYWNLNQRSEPLLRIPSCAVNLHNASSAQKTAVLAVELGDKITLAVLPAQAPSSSLACFIEGVSEQITPDVHRVGFNLSPASVAGVWQLNSSTYSVLGATTRLAY